MKNVIAGLLMIFSSLCYSASAIVLSEDKRVGIAHSFKSVDEAKTFAVTNCQIQTEKKCHVLLSSGKPGWGALAVGRDGFWIILSEKSKTVTELFVMKECDQRFVGCKLVDVFFDSYAIEDYSDIELPEGYKKPEPQIKPEKNDTKIKPKNVKEIEI